jgi:hypothetical protein
MENESYHLYTRMYLSLLAANWQVAFALLDVNQNHLVLITVGQEWRLEIRNGSMEANIEAKHLNNHFVIRSHSIVYAHWTNFRKLILRQASDYFRCQLYKVQQEGQRVEAL